MDNGIGFLVLVALACGFIAMKIAQDRGGNAIGYFALGFLLPVIGIALALLLHHEPLEGNEAVTPPTEGWHRDPTGRFDFRYYADHWTSRVMRLDGREFQDSI